MTDDLTEHLAGLQRAMAAPLPRSEELAAGRAEDQALAERIRKARPGIPLHHAYAVLETLRTLKRVDAAKGEPKPSSFTAVQGRCPACKHSALFLGDGGYVTCGNLQCTDPCAANDLLEAK